MTLFYKFPTVKGMSLRWVEGKNYLKILLNPMEVKRKALSVGRKPTLPVLQQLTITWGK